MRLIPALVTVVTVGIMIIGSILVLRLPEMLSERTPWDSNVPDQSKASLTGGVISAKMNNATIKAEIGRSTWKLLHTMVAQYPEEPKDDERAALQQFITLLSRLYPCGECAEHFQLLLKKYPAQTSSRVSASQWACAIHNKVNERLGKEIFNCADIEQKYQCGCEQDPVDILIATTASMKDE